MKWKRTKKELKRLYKGIQQLLHPFTTQLPGSGENVAIVRPDGSLFMIITVIRDNADSLQIDFFESVQEFMQFLVHVELALQYGMMSLDTMLFRQGLEIKFLEREDMPDSQLKLIEMSGADFSDSKYVPLIVDFIPFTITDFPNEQQQARLVQLVDFLVNPVYQPIVLQALQTKGMSEEGIITLVWDEEQESLILSPELVRLVAAQTNPVITKLFPEEHLPIDVPEFTLYRFSKQIPYPSEPYFEIILHVSPDGVFDEQLQRLVHKYELMIATPDEGLIFVEEFEQLNVADIQQSVLEFLAENQETPIAFLTSGALGIYLVCVLKKLLEHVYVDIGFVEELDMLDSLTEMDLIRFFLENEEIDDEEDS